MAQKPELNDTLAQENWARYQYGKDRGHLEYAAQAQKCEGMYLGGGEQWSEDDKIILREQKRPFYEFNEVMPSVNSAVGYQIKNRADIAFKPRGNGDTQTAATLSKIAMQVASECKFHWKETQVFSDGLIEQRGYWDVRISYEKNMKGDITLSILDPRDVIPDPDAKSYDPSSWSDVTVSKWLTLDEIESLYGKEARNKAALRDDASGDFGDTDEEVKRNSFGSVPSIGLYDAYVGTSTTSHKRFRIIDRQKFVYTMTDCLVFPDSGDIKVIDSISKEQAEAAIAAGAVKARRMQRRVRWTVTTFSATLFDDFSPYDDYTVVPYFGYFRRGKTRGMVDNAIGPQEALNKSVSQFVHIINTSANSGWIVEEDSLTNMDTDDLETNGAKTGIVLEHKKSSKEPKKIEANSVPTGVDRLIDRATQALKDVTVPDSMRGLQSTAVSGVAKQADQFASQQMLALPLDNLAYTRQLLANIMLKLIQRYYDSHRVFRITEIDPLTGKETDSTLEINVPDGNGGYLNDVTIGSYDVVISEQPMQVTFENGQFEQALAMRKEGVAIPDTTVVRYSNLTDKHSIIEAMQNQQAPVDPTLQAKARLIESQAKNMDARTTETNVKAQYSAIQTGQVIATVPQTAALADQLLKSAGYVDNDAAPIVPEVQTGLPAEVMPTNTSPMLPAVPASPQVGVNDGIETQRLDGVNA